MSRHSGVSSMTAVVTAAALVLQVTGVFGMQAAQPASQKAPQKAATPPPATKASATPKAAPAAPDADGGWPRAYSTPSGGRFLLYQPQVASWENQKQMVAYAAVSYEAKGSTKQELGTVTIQSATKVALDERLVRFATLQITEAKFSTLNRDQTREIVDEIVKGIPDQERVISLDRVLAYVDKSGIMVKNVDGVKADPPTIFYSARPAILVNLDGEPIWSPIKDNDLKYAVNTNWDLFQYGPTGQLFLRNDQSWLTATTLKGPWTPAGKLLPSFSKLPANDNWKDVKAALPGKKIDAKAVPTVFVSTTPAEMLLLRGEPSYLLVEGTKDLLWVQNTENDVFRVGKTGPVYYLVAGRWFSSPGFTGPWTFATPSLPDSFTKIPIEHPRSRVLASVPGTPQAAEAVLLAHVPQTARVNRKQIKAPEVAYQGDPVFDPITKTTVSRAVNTDKDILKVGDLYYMCFQGVWFVSKSPQGPWEVTTSIPKEIYEIPASSPAHNVTYVTVVEEDKNDDWATFAVVAGYTGMMVAWGCAVWGSGYYYPPYWGYGGYYPYYYPYFPTYGYGAWYNPMTGAYGRTAVAYGPYGGAGVSARYNPRTGTYSRGAAAWGPYGARGYGEAYNPRTGAYGQTRQGSNVYGSWGSTAVQRGDDWARTARVTNNRGQTTRATQGSGGGEAITRRGPQGSGGVARTGSGDVYAGRDGNVYRRQGDSWQKYDNGSWGDVSTPTPNRTDRATTTGAADRARSGTNTDTINQLNRDSTARSTGSTRTRDTGAYRSGGSSRPAGSYRPSGGMSRGGGGRRR